MVRMVDRGVSMISIPPSQRDTTANGNGKASGHSLCDTSDISVIVGRYDRLQCHVPLLKKKPKKNRGTPALMGGIEFYLRSTSILGDESGSTTTFFRPPEAELVACIIS